MIYDVKYDGRHKVQLVAGGHLTNPNIESVYAGVVSLQGTQLIVFLAELNKLQLWGADAGNAYIKSTTREKVYIVGGPVFGFLEGHSSVIDCALYGLRSSSLCWHQRYSDVLRLMGYTPNKAEADIWSRKNGGLYEYIAVYVDDLFIAARDPSSIVQSLQEKHKFKVKGAGSLTYHLGCNYFHHMDSSLCYGPRMYIDKIMGQYENMFGCKPHEHSSLLDKGNHLENDSSDELDNKGLKRYQTMIGCL
jgi:hypothetical protein